MEKYFIWALVVFSFIFISVSSVLLFVGAHKKTLRDVPFVNREHAVLEDEEARRAMDGPFLTGITLYSESRDQAQFDVTYVVPENDEKTYGIAIYPESSNFKSAPNQLEVGENTIRIAVDFRPASVFVRGEKTKTLNVYINMQSDQLDSVTGEAIVKKVYKRRVIFSKHWSKPKRPMSRLQNTKFHWK